MRTVAVTKRLFLTTLILAAGWNCCEATPIIVGRTPNGFLIGTNLLDSYNQKVCKVHYTGDKVLIIAGQPIKLGYKTSGRVKWLSNIQKDVANISLSTLPPQEILSRVTELIQKRVSQFRQAIDQEGDLKVTYVIALASTEIPRPAQLWIETLNYSKATETFTSRIEHPDMQPGKLMEVVNSQGPQFRLFQLIDAQVIEAELNGANQRHIRSSDPSYRPPYMVLKLSPGGVSVLTKDFGLCTGRYPVY